MKNHIVNILIPFFLIFLASSCIRDMNSSQRIKNSLEFKNINKIAVINTSFDTRYKIKGGETQKSKENPKFVKELGKIHLIDLINISERIDSTFFINVNELRYNKLYKSLDLQKMYIRKPLFISRKHTYISPYEEIGVIEINNDNAANICNTLNVDAILTTEISYELVRGLHIPFLKPKWWALCKNKSKVFNSKGELIWKYDFALESQNKLKADKARHFLIVWSSSINGKTQYELLTAAIKDSSQKLIEALISDKENCLR